MNTRKQVLAMTALLLMMLIITGAYAAWYPSRAQDAGKEFDDLTAGRGAITFSRNCRLCHGDVAEGGALGARVTAAPALDRADLQGFTDISATLASDATATDQTIKISNASKVKVGSTLSIDRERLKVTKIDGTTLTVDRGIEHTTASAHSAATATLLLDAQTLSDKQKYITNTITCGHVGTDMQPWAASQGGPMSDEQIRQLMTLITDARWDLVAEDNDTTDLLATHLTSPLSGESTSMQVSDVSVFTKDASIRMGDERLKVTAVPTLTKDKAGNLPKDRSGTITVTRGALGTTPLEHDLTEKIYNFPDAGATSINQSACGQTAQAAAPPAPIGTIEPFTGQTVNVIASNISFDTKTITVKAGGQVRVRLDNRDNGTDHNIAFYKSSTDTTPVSTGSVGTRFPGVAVDDTVFDVPAAGSYYFRCDVHPTIMFGTFTVTQ